MVADYSCCKKNEGQVSLPFDDTSGLIAFKNSGCFVVQTSISKSEG
jgi:hypothetical protein